MQERLQKILSAHGVASRRESEKLIGDGRVRVNGVTAVLGQSADESTDRIEVDRRPLRTAPDKVYIMLNKPRGYVTTMKDEQGRKNVSELVRGCKARVYPVGRLDLNSEGLLIMTNDGALTNLLTHPSHEKSKTYLVRVRGDAADAAERLSAPMTLDGVQLRPASVRLLREAPDGALLSITIHEGKNRQIRRMCAELGLEVISLKRVGEGGLQLGELRSGCWRYLTEAEITLLKNKNAGIQG
ncbi:23S rRNA pseudouridine2605 synthase [Sporobacter termitidis DSM 10068]|uniref:Pseudouridine synthase n=1 Tax=Sporobacter termitidis DSM 10068 TaxID=1123282 RepID=A0A1M5TKI3_9FIRM|nr:pseudouridine synthase [Sporobacter termitidis]SHH50853.1 23S rRNA pseudouridine2605 synthase [Sporobacter termitidis DSM 10068]